MKPLPPVLVLGIGDSLPGDAGAGAQALLRMEREIPPPGVHFFAGDSKDAPPVEALRGVRALIVLAAAHDGWPSGTVHYRQLGHVTECPGVVGPAARNWAGLLGGAAAGGLSPEVHAYTISVDPLGQGGESLSPPVAAALPVVARSALTLAERLAAEFEFD